MNNIKKFFSNRKVHDEKYYQEQERFEHSIAGQYLKLTQIVSYPFKLPENKLTKVMIGFLVVMVLLAVLAIGIDLATGNFDPKYLFGQ